jgi:uncharacterized protein YbbC (DUF1343 family)
VTSSVTTGLAAACRRPESFPGARYGLITNFTGVTSSLTGAAHALIDAGIPVVALFGPEHGLQGSVQAGETEGSTVDETTGLPIFETYLKSEAELDALISASGVDGLIFDMQDIGVRFYTYMWTMLDCMRSAARLGVPFIVLDRPNPLGGTAVSGPGLDPAFASFVGRLDIPMRHGLTMGELARWFSVQLAARAEPAPQLDVVRLEGWDPGTFFEATGLPWVPPSPNMPTIDTALAFCGTGLFEGTNVSEGRGTTKPFELIGAPYVDGRLVAELRAEALPGVALREAWFVPTFHKYAGQTLRGVELHVTDRARFEPVRFAVQLMAAFARLYPDDFSFLVPGERVDAPERGYAIDRLWGNDTLRLAVQNGRDPRGLIGDVTSPDRVYPQGTLLYDRELAPAS